MKKICLALICILFFSTASAQESSFDFKGIALGSAIALTENNPRFECKDSQSPIADRICSLKFGEKETIAGVPIQVLFLGYFGGKLGSINISFLESHFADVVSALSEKYGEGELKTEAVRNKAGVSFENRIYTWRKSNTSLRASRFSSTTDRSSVMYRDDAAIKEFTLRRKAIIKEKAGDL